MSLPILIEQADNQEKVYVYIKDDGKKIALNSLYSPTKEAEKFLNKHSFDKKVIILFGIGNGRIVKKILEENSFIYLYIIEPFEEIEMDEQLNEMIFQSDKVYFEYQRDFNNSSIRLRAILQLFLGVEVEIIIHPHYDKTESDKVKHTIEKLSHSITGIQVNINTEQIFSKDWIIEPLLNLQYNMTLTSINELKDKFKGQRAILAAAGPSLKENIVVLKDLQKSCYIFAAGSAVNGLMNNGITPDFVTSFDSSIINYDVHFKNSTYSGPLIAGSIVNSNILKYHSGKVILVNEAIDNITSRARPDVPKIPSVPSVAIFTLQMIDYLGFNEVFLVGQDLALINGKYYSEGVHEHNASKNEKVALYVENNIGEQVGTTYPLYMFLETFVEIIKTMDKNKIKIYNMSKYGAKIEGTTYLPKEELKNNIIRNEIELKLNLKEVSEEGLIATQDIINELKDFSKVVRKAKRTLNSFTLKISVKELKKIYRLFINLRKYSVYEEVIIRQFSFLVSKISNAFEYTFEKEQYTEEDLSAMKDEIKKLIEATVDFLDSLLEDSRIKELENVINERLKKK